MPRRVNRVTEPFLLSVPLFCPRVDFDNRRYLARGIFSRVQLNKKPRLCRLVKTRFLLSLSPASSKLPQISSGYLKKKNSFLFFSVLSVHRKEKEEDQTSSRQSSFCSFFQLHTHTHNRSHGESHIAAPPSRHPTKQHEPHGTAFGFTQRPV